MYCDFKSGTFDSSGYSAQGTIILQHLSDCFCQLINCNNTSTNPVVQVRPELKQSIEVTLRTDNGDNACVLVICCRNATRYARPTSHVACSPLIPSHQQCHHCSHFCHRSSSTLFHPVPSPTTLLLLENHYLEDAGYRMVGTELGKLVLGSEVSSCGLN